MNRAVSYFKKWLNCTITTQKTLRVCFVFLFSFKRQKNLLLSRSEDCVCCQFLEWNLQVQSGSQGLSSYRPLRARRDPGTCWSRVSQNLGDDNQIIKGRGGLVGILSILNPRECRMCCQQKNQEWNDILILQVPRKMHLSSGSGNPSCCRLGVQVKDVTYM